MILGLEEKKTKHERGEPAEPDLLVPTRGARRPVALGVLSQQKNNLFNLARKA